MYIVTISSLADLIYFFISKQPPVKNWTILSVTLNSTKCSRTMPYLDLVTAKSDCPNVCSSKINANSSIFLYHTRLCKLIFLETTVYNNKVYNNLYDIQLKSSISNNNTYTQPFYGSLHFVQDNPGEPVPKKHSPTHTYRSHQSSISAASI